MFENKLVETVNTLFLGQPEPERFAACGQGAHMDHKLFMRQLGARRGGEVWARVGWRTVLPLETAPRQAGTGLL